jgi:hypothetical protein
MGPGLARMQAAMNYCKHYWVRGGVRMGKGVDEG